MELLFDLIGFMSIGVLWVHSEPMIRFRNLIIKKKGFFYRLLSCAKCSAFHIYLWSHIIFYFVNQNLDFNNFYVTILGAAIVSIGSELISKELSSGGFS